jgi:hypothetical protein
MEKINRNIMTAVIASESIHIFCCVLPTVFSVISLMAGAGMIAAMPGFIDNAHDIIHDYELPMIVASAVILALGWVLYLYSRRLNCRTEGACSHEPCTPKKDRTKIVMIAATVLFVFNVAVYFGLHRSHDHHAHLAEGHDHAMIHNDDEHNHDHGHDHHNH